ncbi:MAG: glycosyltransferase family 4 protein [Bacteroidales bacterium]|nr:glycosyltransferase family 4 protein [Bacteroidales bacterium]
MPIRLLVISNYKDYHTTRPEAEIFKSLAKYKKFEIFIMTLRNSEHVPEFEAVGIKIIDFHPQKKNDKLEIARIRKELVDNNIDIVHLFNSKAIYNGTKAAKGLKVKVVLYRGFSSNVNKLDPFANLKFMNPRVDKILCNSIGVAEHLHKQPFFDKSKTVVIHKGHDVSWYENIVPANIRAELGVSSDSLLLVNVANNRKMKGIPYLLKAIVNLPKDADVHLLLVGRDMDTKENLKIVEQGGVKDKIHFMGFRKDALNIVAGSDAFVLPSIFGESITKSVLEAMSLGVAPIISDIRGNFELLEDTVSGLVFESKNVKDLSQKIMKLYNDRSLCKEFGKNAQLRIKNVLNNEQTVLKIKDFYEQIIDS